MTTKVIPIIQHVDKPITQSKYRAFGENLLITGYWRTIQSEGPLNGYPAVFVRLAGCNFGAKSTYCQFCDTSFEFDKGQLYSPTSLLDRLTHLEGYRSTDVLVITGGEPTLQHNLIDFMNMAKHYFKRVQIETNGTQPSFFAALSKVRDGFATRGLVNDLPMVVVSPKLNYKSGEYVIPNDLVLDHTHALKFVVAAEGPHRYVPDWAVSLRHKHGFKLYVSPMAVYLRPYDGEVSSIWEDGLIDKEATAKNYAYAAEFAMKHGFLLSIQSHLFTALP